jgi:hypothetical protein
MRFAKWTFLIATVYGVVVLVPFYFLENDPRAVPLPTLTHPEFYYGFVGVALAWQAVFYIISTDPVKYRLLMLPAIFEKFSFAGALWVLHLQGRFPEQMLLAGLLDFTLGVLFVASFAMTKGRPKAEV